LFRAGLIILFSKSSSRADWARLWQITKEKLRLLARFSPLKRREKGECHDGTKHLDCGAGGAWLVSAPMLAAAQPKEGCFIPALARLSDRPRTPPSGIPIADGFRRLLQAS